MTFGKVNPAAWIVSEKKVLASSPGALACTLMDLGVFGSVGTHFPSEKSILPYFSTPRGVAILVCDSHRQAGSSRETWMLRDAYIAAALAAENDLTHIWSKLFLFRVHLYIFVLVSTDSGLEPNSGDAARGKVDVGRCVLLQNDLTHI